MHIHIFMNAAEEITPRQKFVSHANYLKWYAKIFYVSFDFHVHDHFKISNKIR